MVAADGGLDETRFSSSCALHEREQTVTGMRPARTIAIVACPFPAELPRDELAD